MRRIFVLLPLLLFTVLRLAGEWWDEGSFDWGSGKKLAEGVVYAHIVKKSPRLMDMWVMRFDLRKRKFTFHTGKKAPEYGEPIATHPQRKLTIRTRRQTTADFMREAREHGIKMIAAFNAPPWSPWDKVYSKYADRLGLLISDGELISPVIPGRPSFTVYDDDTVDFRNFKAADDLSRVRTAVTGFSRMLTGGKVDSSDKSLAPRTGFGLSGDRRFFYVVVIDGRQSRFSMGSTVGEVGFILRHLGAADGLNMDGGGSSSFVIWNRRKKQPEMLNHQPAGIVRAVGASLGVAAD